MKISKIVIIATLAAGLCVFPSCAKKETAAKSPAPAKVANAVPEAALATLTLTPKAVERLGIVSAKAEIKAVPRVLRVGGEIIAPPGGLAVVAAPQAGVVLAPGNGAMPVAGARVAKGQPIARLLILPLDKDLLGAKSDLEVKAKQFEVAEARAKRSETLLKDKAVSEKANQENQAALAAADGAYKAAKARWEVLNGKVTEADAADLATITLASPIDGVIGKTGAAPGQNVNAGAVLFEVDARDPLWVRVPVYVGDLSSVDAAVPAQVGTLGAAPGEGLLEARPVQGPARGDAGSASADLYYELRNPDRTLRVGQKVDALLSLRGTENGLVVPWSSILFDMQGGTWVYVRPAAETFIRRRVEILHVVGGQAVIGRGLAAGEEVVTVGAAELFGTEFGAGK